MKPTHENIIKIHNATVFRGMHKVFSSLSLCLKTGENTAILGPNGSGKSTLLKLITREVLPVVASNSYCHLFGEDRITIWDLRKKIGIVSQDFQNDYRALATGKDVVISAFFGSIGLHEHNIVTQDMENQADKVLNNLDLVHLANRQYLQLSTGQQRRLLLARALIHKPKVLIFDEPTSGLDMKASFQVIDDMRELTQNGTTLIVVTHHIHEIIPEVERLVLLKNGAIVADGKKDKLLTDAKITELFDIQIQLKQSGGFYQAFPA